MDVAKEGLVGVMEEAVLQVLDAVLAFAPPDPPSTRFRLEWHEPIAGPAAEAVRKLQHEYLDNLSDEKKRYIETSLPRYRFVANAALQHFSRGGKILDLGCAPGHMGIILHNLGFEMHGIDLNQLWEETYLDREWLQTLHVQALDVERQPLPFPDATFDGAVFAEVLEHIAIASPVQVMQEIRRVLKPEAKMLLTTPNVCNLANILALAKGKNIFWAPEIFYGGTDRHNREYTPAEVVTAVEQAELQVVDRFLFNGPNNWNGAAAEQIYDALHLLRGLECPLLGNTVFVVAQRSKQ